MFRLPESLHLEIIDHALLGLPAEACGLIGGRLNKAEKVYRLRNAEVDSPVTRYILDSREQFQAMKDAEARGGDIIACFHSHTHTEAYPSPTDIAQAGYPEWWYLILSLKAEEPMLRAYRIIDGKVTEEPITLERG